MEEILLKVKEQQLAMMEDAERTGIFVEKMADFFRYNVKKGQEDATLGEELEAVDNYIYILNVRFAGDIHFSKEVDESLENVRMPSMILWKMQSIMEYVTLNGKEKYISQLQEMQIIYVSA